MILFPSEVFYPSVFPPLLYKNIVGDSVKDLFKVEVNDIYCSALFHKSSHGVREGSQDGHIWFALDKYIFGFQSPFGPSHAQKCAPAWLAPWFVQGPKWSWLACVFLGYSFGLSWGHLFSPSTRVLLQFLWPFKDKTEWSEKELVCPCFHLLCARVMSSLLRQTEFPPSGLEMRKLMYSC